MFEDHNSDWINITSGVPQGSVLGPLSFIIFVNDIPDVVSSIMSTFADDTRLYCIVKSLQDELADLNNVMGWAEESKFSFNFDKCHSMSIGHSPSLFIVI